MCSISIRKFGKQREFKQTNLLINTLPPTSVHAVKVITLRKKLFFEKINVLCNGVHLDMAK